eukprot:scaffold5885_cov201-Amphora_coffeaeformis.AAC.1
MEHPPKRHEAKTIGTMTDNKTEIANNDTRRYSTRQEQVPLPMSLIGLHERALHFPDLWQNDELPAPSTSDTNGLAPLQVCYPLQDSRSAFREHLLSVLDEAIRLINEDVMS